MTGARPWAEARALVARNRERTFRTGGAWSIGFPAWFEHDEQLAAARFVGPDDVVLELGGRFGTVSAVLLDVLRSRQQLVVVEPDAAVVPALRRNLAAAGHPRARVFRGVVGDGPQALQRKGLLYGLATTTAACGPDEACVPSASMASLQRRYAVRFDTVVADCEGCLPAFLEHACDTGTMAQVRKVIFEDDGGNGHLRAVARALRAAGLRRVARVGRSTYVYARP